MISVLFGLFQIVCIDFFSIWLLGHPCGILCQRDPSFEKRQNHINYTLGLPLATGLIDFLFFGCVESVLIDFFYVWSDGNVLNICCFYLHFVSEFISFLFGYWGILGAPFAKQTPLLKKPKTHLITRNEIRTLLGRPNLGNRYTYTYIYIHI